MHSKRDGTHSSTTAKAQHSRGWQTQVPGAWGFDEWFHEIRSDEDGMFVTYRKESQQGGEFGRPWREDGDRD